jgi:hypothetical protein
MLPVEDAINCSEVNIFTDGHFRHICLHRELVHKNKTRMNSLIGLLLPIGVQQMIL